MAIIAVLLVAVLVLWPQKPPNSAGGEQPGGPDKPVAAEGMSNGDPVYDVTVIPEDSSAPPSASKEAPVLVIVIDDVGNNLPSLNKFLTLPIPLTFAVMPQRPFTREAGLKIQAADQEVILHQPMEPLGTQDPGPGTIYDGMKAGDISALLEKNFIDLPMAKGFNNHMGSKVTGDRATMDRVLAAAKGSGKFFLDSATIGGTAAQDAAVAAGVPYIRRNSMFLDNEDDAAAIRRALYEGVKQADTRGYAVMIGHVWSDNLADILLKEYPELLEDGYHFERISELLLGEHDR